MASWTSFREGRDASCSCSRDDVQAEQLGGRQQAPFRRPPQADLPYRPGAGDLAVAHGPVADSGDPARGAGTMATPSPAATKPRTVDRSSPSKTTAGRNPA